MTDKPVRIDLAYASTCWDTVAVPAAVLGERPAIDYLRFVEILAAIYAHGVASEAVLGDLENWKPTGFLNTPPAPPERQQP